ncbi:MAG: ectoine/hydroxyectoine ABC transporter substrate-binding protein EhuB [Pseudonocardia sp.]|nr:ectoine/hydroxyectoine ABC transporter substrate-binding protein EhuB [Pseudonocardia sp.]
MLSRRRLLALVGVGAGAGVLATGCARDERPTLQRIREDGTVRVGISGEQPFGYLDSSGRLTGESPEVARAVLAGIGAPTLEAVQRPFGQLIPGLLDGHFDLITAGMEITPGRCAQVGFSRPDFVAPTAFLVPNGNPKGLRGFTDVARAGIPIAVLGGSVEQDAARDAGVPEAQIKTYDLPTQLYQAVFDGDVPVASLTDISLRSLLRQHPQPTLEVTAPVARTNNGRPVHPAAGFAFRPADTDLRDAFNTGLTALQDSGAWLRIATPFGVTAANLPPRDLTTAELCQAS